MIPGITFYSLPNDLIIGVIFMMSILSSLLLIRILYIRMHAPHHYPSDPMNLAVLGGRSLKALAVLMLIALSLLGFRVNASAPRGSVDEHSMWTLDALTRGWWCIIRITLGALAALCAAVADKHWILRMWPSVTAPLIPILDLISQSHLATRISCIEHGLCVDDDDEKSTLYNLAWRDIVSSIISLTFTMVCIWLWLQYGLYSNDLSLPRAELRAMSQRLDKTKWKKNVPLGPDGMRRRGMVDDNQFEKMLGLN